MKDYLRVEDISAYKIVSELSCLIYETVSGWNWFDKRTLGVQMVTAFDSIAANIAEGFGRYHKKDKMKFYYNARGSVFESLHWLKTARGRNLLSKNKFEQIISSLDLLPKEINNLIRLTNKNLKQ